MLTLSVAVSLRNVIHCSLCLNVHERESQCAGLGENQQFQFPYCFDKDRREYQQF